MTSTFFDDKRCLIMQSHVVHGYVGNRSATFPLQLAGFEVDCINSVQLSTHTGYPGGIRGQRLGTNEIQVLLQGLQENGLLAGYSHVLSGYTPSRAALEGVVAAVKAVREAAAVNTSIASSVSTIGDTSVVDPPPPSSSSSFSSSSPVTYVCDPVLGDGGALYVPEELVEAYKVLAIPHATILTPNQFEAEVLTGLKITDCESAIAVFEALHALGAETVVITSTDRLAVEATDEMMLLLVSCPWNHVRDSSPNKNTTTALPLFSSLSGDGSATHHARFAIAIPKLSPGEFTGTGDLIAALLLAHTSAHPTDYVTAVENAIASVYAVCKRTHEYHQAARHAVGLPPYVAARGEGGGGGGRGSRSSSNVRGALDEVTTGAGAISDTAAAAAVVVSSSSYPRFSASTLVGLQTVAKHTLDIHEAKRQKTLQASTTTTTTTTTTTNSSSSSIDFCSVKIPAFNELRLIQSKQDLETPPLHPTMLRARRLEELMRSREER